jgi:hypothetical protein
MMQHATRANTFRWIGRILIQRRTMTLKESLSGGRREAMT